MWRVIFIDKWIGESACVYRFHGYDGEGPLFLDKPAVAKLWSPYVKPRSALCLQFRYRFQGAGGRLSVMKHVAG